MTDAYLFIFTALQFCLLALGFFLLSKPFPAVRAMAVFIIMINIIGITFNILSLLK